MKIGVISDTHGLLRPEVIQQLRGCDCLLHAGDINTPALLDTLRTIAPVHAVRGNNDKEWAEGLPLSLSLNLAGYRVFMVHNKKDVPADTEADIIVFGHSHQYFERLVDGCLWLNPGSCGKRRFHQEITMALLHLDTDGCRVERIVLPSPPSAS